MKCEKLKNGYYNLSLTKEEIDNIAKSIFYADELKKNQILLKGLTDFLLEIGKRFLQITD